MDRKFAQLVVILMVAAVGYSILGSSGSTFRIDVQQLKTILLYILLGASVYAIYVTIRSPRRPPGV